MHIFYVYKKVEEDLREFLRSLMDLGMAADEAHLVLFCRSS